MTTRPVIEIERAHDALVGILRGEIPVLMSAHDKERLTVAADVLCWVLMHEHNTTFGENLERILKELEKAGVRLSDHGN